MNLILNPMKLETMFERLLCAGDVTSRQTIASSIERGIKLGLESLCESRMMYPEAVRCLLSYIKFFDKEIVFNMRGEAIFLICETILGITFEGYRGEIIIFHLPRLWCYLRLCSLPDMFLFIW